MAVGFKQKKFVEEIVKKVYTLRFFHAHGVFFLMVMESCDLQFLVEEFDVMLFHYDGVVDEWREMEWSDTVIHVSATNQTKW